MHLKDVILSLENQHQ